MNGEFDDYAPLASAYRAREAGFAEEALSFDADRGLAKVLAAFAPVDYSTEVRRRLRRLPSHRTIVAVDVVGDRARTSAHQLAVRNGLHAILRQSFTEVGVDLNACAVEKRMDGAVILVPPEVPENLLADQLPNHLVAGIKRHNACHVPEAAVQLRMGLHSGDKLGPGIRLAWEMLESPETKQALSLSSTELALVASELFYRNVIQHDPAANPNAYRQIPVRLDEMSFSAWIRVSGRLSLVGSARQRPAVHRTILVVDVEGFGDRTRTNDNQVAVRAGLYRALEQGLARAGIPWAACDHEDRGDGVFVLAPADLPKGPFVEQLPATLAEAIREHNAGHPSEERIRLRMALHAGEVRYDRHGVTGTAINLAFRLLDAHQLKAALANSTGELAVIVSSWFYDEVVWHSPTKSRDSFGKIWITAKETNTAGWIRLVPSG